MYIVSVPNRSSPPAILIRESYREDGKVKNRTIANISHWPSDRIEAVRKALLVAAPRGRRAARPLLTAAPFEDQFEIVRSRPHGHVAAVLGTMSHLGLPRILTSHRCRERDLAVALVVQRILDPGTKLSMARALDTETLHSTLGECLGIQSASVDELYEAMDWLQGRQKAIETALAKKHLKDGSLVLYDLTSVHMEGRTCPLARLGYSRDGHKGKLQIEFGLVTDEDGCPVAVEVFGGNVADPGTVGVQVAKVRERFGLKNVVLVGDRGMITQARIREDLEPNGLDWITALRAPAIKSLVESGALQMSLFDERDLAEIEAPDYPGERLVVCRNPLLACERARKREELLQATERQLERIAVATRRAARPLRGEQAIALRLGRVLGRYKVGKHFDILITEDRLTYTRRAEQIAKEAALDGLYVVRTSLDAERLSAEDTVSTYKRLSRVERAFRSLKTVDLKVRPIHHRLEERVRAHVFLCMLAFYVEWHMRQRLAPLLFDDEEPEEREALRSSVVAPARRSPRAMAKVHAKRTEDGTPVHDFKGLLRNLATITKNLVAPRGFGGHTFDKLATPTPLQNRVFKLLKVPLTP